MALIAEATVDAYNEAEQRMGFYTMIEEHLDMPFKATILGVSVVVERVDLADDDQPAGVVREKWVDATYKGDVATPRCGLAAQVRRDDVV